ncbi:MAG: hypothetical protein R3D59_03575 [Paracoccaceae bacterium]
MSISSSASPRPSAAACSTRTKPSARSKDASNIAEGFRISGLGQLIEMGIQTDRLVTFGD